MSLQAKLSALIAAIGADYKAIIQSRGSLAALTTSDKTNIVAALNEVRQIAVSASTSGGAVIDDDATNEINAWSSQKIADEISDAISALVDGAPTALDTLKEIADALANQDDAVGGLVTAVGNRLRYDAAQSLTAPQKAQACENAGAVSLVQLGDPETDLVNLYTAAKA